MSTNTPPTPQSIINYLKQHPDFFLDHADQLLELKLPAHNQGGVISFVERQAELLQNKTHTLEQQLHTLITNAQRSENIRQRMHHWACSLISHPEWTQQPDKIAQALAQTFELDFATLVSAQALADASDKLPKNFVGPTADLPAALRQQLQLPDSIQSMAYSALIAPESEQSLGLMVLGAQDKNHFSADMATDFLDQIGALCAAALDRAQPQNN